MNKDKKHICLLVFIGFMTLISAFYSFFLALLMFITMAILYVFVIERKKRDEDINYSKRSIQIGIAAFGMIGINIIFMIYPPGFIEFSLGDLMVIVSRFLDYASPDDFTDIYLANLIQSATSEEEIQEYLILKTFLEIQNEQELSSYDLPAEEGFIGLLGVFSLMLLVLGVINIGVPIKYKVGKAAKTPGIIAEANRFRKYIEDTYDEIDNINQLVRKNRYSEAIAKLEQKSEEIRVNIENKLEEIKNDEYLDMTPRIKSYISDLRTLEEALQERIDQIKLFVKITDIFEIATKVRIQDICRKLEIPKEELVQTIKGSTQLSESIKIEGESVVLEGSEQVNNLLTVIDGEFDKWASYEKSKEGKKEKNTHTDLIENLT
jgi:hypothetical protein